MKRNKIPKILHDYRGAADSRLQTQTLGVIKALTNNSYFADIGSLLTDLQTAYDAFTSALADAKTKDKNRVSVKNDRRDDLVTTMTSVANYCTLHGESNRTILLSTGFTISSESGTSKELGAVSNFAVAIGKPGIATLSVDKVQNANTYLFLWRATGTAGNLWNYVMTKSNTQEIAGIDRLKDIDFKIEISGAGKKNVSTEIITQVVV